MGRVDVDGKVTLFLKIIFFCARGGGGEGGRDGCDRRSEVFMKIKKKIGGGRGGG